VKLKRIINFTKGPRKKLEIKIMKTELENIRPSIWIERWNWKQIKLQQKGEDQKLEIKKIRIEIEISTTKMTKL